MGVAPASGLREADSYVVGVERLPEEMNSMKIRDDKVCASLIVILEKHHVSRVVSLVFRHVSLSL